MSFKKYYEVNKWIADNKSANQLAIYPCTNSRYDTMNQPTEKASRMAII